jgi:hypothetical protein
LPDFLSKRPADGLVSVGAAAPRAAYTTRLGAALVGDARELMNSLAPESVDLVVTSPPYALHFKKEYGNVAKRESGFVRSPRKSAGF